MENSNDLEQIIKSTYSTNPLKTDCIRDSSEVRSAITFTVYPNTRYIKSVCMRWDKPPERRLNARDGAPSHASGTLSRQLTGTVAVTLSAFFVRAVARFSNFIKWYTRNYSEGFLSPFSFVPLTACLGWKVVYVAPFLCVEASSRDMSLWCITVT